MNQNQPTEYKSPDIYYPSNLGFFEYLQSTLRKQTGKAFETLPRFKRVFEYTRAVLKILGMILMDAAVELILVILFGFVIVKMSQGRDIIVSMFEPKGNYGEIRIVLTIAAVTAFSVSMWLIPAFLFEKRNQWSKSSKDVFKLHLFFAHRILPLIPFWLLAFSLFNDSAWFFILLAAVELVFLSFFNVFVIGKRKRQLVLMTVALIFIVVTIYFFVNYHYEYLSVKRAMAAMLYLFSILIYQFYHKMDRNILDEHIKGIKTRNVIKRYPFNSTFYILYFAVHIIVIVAIAFNKLQIGIAPESMLLYVFAFYVFLIDIIAYIGRLHPIVNTGGVVVGLVLIVLFVKGAISFNVKHNEIDRKELSAKQENFKMLSFDDYYKSWRQRMLEKDSTKPFPIVLIAGEGGGSRAGYWFSQNLIDFDYRTNGWFRDHVFSISTVSGSTVGLGTYLAYLELPIGKQGIEKSVNSEYLELPSMVYKTNFVGSSISGLFITDFFKSIFNTGSLEDRNNILMREESASTIDAIFELTKKKKSEINCLLDHEYMGLFYDSNKNYSTFSMQRPLSFINTCRSNDGRRGIFAPIKLDESVFSDAIDINGYIYNDPVLYQKHKIKTFHDKKGVTFGQACISSELFPIFSAPLYIDSLGSFVDGGYHENSGLKTTIDIYSKLKTLLDTDKEVKDRYVIYIVYLKNGSDVKDLYVPKKATLGITQPVSALVGQPFNGSASYFEEKAKYIGDTSNKTWFLKVPLGNKISFDSTAFASTAHERKIQNEILNDLRQKEDTSALNFPLARWLSVSVIDRMRKYQRNYSDTSKLVQGLLSKIRVAH